MNSSIGNIGSGAQYDSVRPNRMVLMSQAQQRHRKERSVNGTPLPMRFMASKNVTIDAAKRRNPR